MSRDPIVEGASRRLEYIFSRSQKLTQTWFRGVESDPKSFRITILAVMKMMVSLMQMETPTSTPVAPATTEIRSREPIPNFNPQDLMLHEWKGKTLSVDSRGEKVYARGSLSWGWDKKENFNKETIRALEKGPLQIEQYEFTLLEKIVQAKKVKKSNLGDPHRRMDQAIRGLKHARWPPSQR